MSMFISPGWWVGFVRAGKKNNVCDSTLCFCGLGFSSFLFFSNWTELRYKRRATSGAWTDIQS